MKNLIVVFTLLLVPLNAMNVAQVVQESSQSSDIQHITRETAWLVHVSRLFPQDGTLVPGSIAKVVLGKDNFGERPSLPEFDSQEVLRKQATAVVSCARNTLHWSVNSMVYPHSFKGRGSDGNEVNGELTREEQPYGILEPMSMFRDKHLSGYWQDVYHWGSHTLSNQSVIFVPTHDTSFESYRGTFSGTIQHYEGSLRNAIEGFLRGKNLSIMYPAQHGQKVDEISILKSGDEKLSVFVDEKVFSCDVLSRALNLDNTTHSGSSIGMIEGMLLFLIGPMRGIMTIEHMRNCFDHIEEHGELVCSQCKKSAQQITQNSLLRCAKCKIAYYCSQACQRDHWGSSHKRRCAMLANLHSETYHATYLSYCDNAKNQPGFYIDALYNPLKKLFTDLRLAYTLSRDRQQIDYYERVVFLLVSHLYSAENQYVKKRAEFAIGTEEGFKKFCQYVLKEVDKLKNSASSQTEGSNSLL